MAADRPLSDALESLADRLTQAVSALLPAGAAADVRSRIDGVMGGMFERLDLVPREEFERQLETLKRLEARLATLEARLATLERGRSADR